MARSLPPIVLALTHNFEAWIIGSAANPNVKDPRDIDVVVPHSRWNDAAYAIPKNAKVNSFGGWKFIDDGIEIDVWPGELSFLMVNEMAAWLWQPRHDIRWGKMADPNKPVVEVRQTADQAKQPTEPSPDNPIEPEHP